jgi:uncharacterized membrane protein (DUF373 family)
MICYCLVNIFDYNSTRFNIYLRKMIDNFVLLFVLIKFFRSFLTYKGKKKVFRSTGLGGP